MSLRVNPDLNSTLLASLAENRRREDQALQEVSSGQKLNSISDDSAAVASLIGNRMQSSATDQFLQNISKLRSSTQVADSTLNSMILALTRAISLGTQGANGTLTLENRQAIAKEARGLQEQLLSLANSSFQGVYLFAGTAVTSAPFVLDASSASGVSYVGNTGVNSVEISGGQALPVNLPGSQIFTQPGYDVFQAMHDLVDSLESGGDIEGAANKVQQAFNYINTQRSFYGSTLARLDTAELFLNQEKLELSTTESNLLGADMAEAATNLVQAENSRNATLAAGARISQLSLLDFLQ
jgi:flagellar hook-associated protein 3 FlgL